MQSGNDDESRRRFLASPVVASAAQFVPALASPRGGEVSLRDFGAVTDGRTLNTRAIQTAIDACYAAGGGRVVVPAGDYVTGTVRLRSRVTLVIESGARLLGSRRIADYPKDAGVGAWHPRFSFSQELCGSLIYAERAEDVGVEGPGIIDGSQGGGSERNFPNQGDPERRRPMLVRMHDCLRVRLRDVTLAHPASFTSFFVGCRGVLIDDVRVRSRETGNGDGLDFDGCQDVRISNCDLDTGDDAIGLKTFQPGLPNRNFVITNCVITSRWAALRLGPESFADMRGITMSNCVFHDCRDGLKIQSCEGAVMENLMFSDLVMEDVARPFFLVHSSFGMSKYAQSPRPPVGILRNVHMANIRAAVPKNPTGKGFEQPCLAIVGLPGHPVENVSISNLDVSMPGGGTSEQASRMDVPELLDEKSWPEPGHFGGELPASGIYLRHVAGARLQQVNISVTSADARPFIAGDDVEDVRLSNVTGSGFPAAPGLVKFADARSVWIQGCAVRVKGQPPRKGVNADAAQTDRPLVVPVTPEEQKRLDRLRKQRPSQVRS